MMTVFQHPAIVNRVMVSIALVLVLAGSAFAEKIYVKGKTARMRAGPGTQYQTLWEAPRLTPLEYLARYKAWYAVRDRSGDVAWVHKQVIGKGMSAIVVTKKANIRKTPGTAGPIAFVVETGYLFKVLKKKGTWYKVKDDDGDGGWVLDKLLWVSR